LIEGSNYRFSDGGIHVKSSVAEADIQWKAFREVVETRTAFLLFPASNLAHTLPLRCFGSGATIQAARGLFRANVPKARLHGQSN
jgi:hypothetical protein